jgi:hypothetical protein
MIKPISMARFEALSFTRDPRAKLYSEEREWYADLDENVLGTVFLDTEDSDWGFIVLGRDELARFSAIGVEINFSDVEKARQALHIRMLEISTNGQKVFPQGHKLKRRKIFQLFNPMVPPEKKHPNFVVLSESAGFSPARELSEEIAHVFEDPDRNYIQQFQSDGFDARLWELYLYAVLHENDFSISRDFHAPDYVCSKYGFRLALEATTVNPTRDGDTVESVNFDPDGVEMADYMAIKFANALYAKLQKRYWELPHIKDKPLVLAIADFEKPEGVHYSAKFVQEYLYGVRQSREGNRNVNTRVNEHVYGTRRKPSGFFSLPDSENISAVLFSDGGTISKFNRMGKLAGFGKPDVTMLRLDIGTKLLQVHRQLSLQLRLSPLDILRRGPKEFMFSTMLTPSILSPPALFPDASHAVFINEQFAITVPDRFPIWSKTFILSLSDMK